MFTPYVTTAEFKAHPTYLDLDGLRSGSTSATDQDAELDTILRKASEWADGYSNQPLSSHVVRQKGRARYNRDGNLVVQAANGPVRAVSSLSVGPTPTALTTTSNPTYWDENGVNLVFPPTSGAWSGALQFGGGRPGGQVFTVLDYVAGWVSTTLTASATAAATSLAVFDAIGIMPGITLRLWEPTGAEYVTIADTWTPLAPVFPARPRPATVPLAAPLANAHSAGMGLSGLNTSVHQAVIHYGQSMLLRPATTAEDSYPNTSTGANTRKKDPRKNGSGLVAEAQRLLSGAGVVRVW